MKKVNKEIIRGILNIFSEKPYQIGIAMSGGGIRGMCHAGVLKALEEFDIRPDIISGVSAGSIVGALYADGYTPDEIAGFFENVEFRKMTKVRIPNGGLFGIGSFEKFLAGKLRAKTFEELKIPLRIVATNLDKGESVVFSSGNLLDAIIASSTFPVLFTPKVINGENYIDGGVFKNFPVSTIRDDCEKVIGINASPLVADKYKMSVLNVAIRSYNFMFKANILHDKELCDYLIEPVDMANYETFETEKSREIFELGYQTARTMIENKLNETKNVNYLINKKQ
ncbi:MAG TPA: patatin-like phospholipase family protein [Paludibacteraceae bacterium]|nr:patatin-like phospholipase family protein [Paludibacteraceae bacterium]